MTTPMNEKVEAFVRRERLASRLLFLTGLVVFAGAMFFFGSDKPPAWLIPMTVGGFAKTKFGLAFLGRRVGWAAWPALVAEGSAFAGVGALIHFGLKVGDGDLLGMLVAATIVVLLAVAGLIRRRALERVEEAQ